MSIDGLSDSDCQQGRLSECKSLLGCVFSDEFFVPLLGDMDEPRNTRSRRKKIPSVSFRFFRGSKRDEPRNARDARKKVAPVFFCVLFGESGYRLTPFIVIKPCGKR